MVLSFAFLFFLARHADAEQNKYYVPVLPATESMDLGLALTNLGPTEVSVSLIARDYSGSLVQGTGITNPAVIQIPPSAQRALRTTEIFGNGMAGKTGWAEVTADAAVKGFFLLFDSTVSFIDGADLQSAGSNRLIFQRATANSKAFSTISFVNISGQALTGVTLNERSLDDHARSTRLAKRCVRNEQFVLMVHRVLEAGLGVFRRSGRTTRSSGAALHVGII